MATSKALRTPPLKVTDNYIASIKRIFGDPETISDSRFLTGKYIVDGKHNPGSPPATWPSATNEGSYSVTEPIGFAVTINGKTYKHFSVSMAGWIFLRDPAGGGTGSNFYQEILNAFTNIYDNNAISSTFSYNHLFLPVWFDRNHTFASDPYSLYYDLNGYWGSSDFTYGNDQKIVQGSSEAILPYDSIDYGVRYVNHYDPNKGKCLLVRWTVTRQYYPGKRFKFELALFENGTIEYRYWPIKNFTEGTSYILDPGSSATVGVFWSSSEFGSDKFRDFAPLLDYSLGERTLSPLGGASYDPSYIDSSQYYSDSISESYWPKNGAVITFSPPTNPGVFLPRKISSLKDSAKNLTPSKGLFDDRKTINFYSGSHTLLRMPSTLPSRLLGNSSDINIAARQLLFTGRNNPVNNDLIVTGSMKKHIIDSSLETLNVLEHAMTSKDFSFNESGNKLVSSTEETSFYATGSSLELFGEGFTAPLKSKTQLKFSLPITKQVTMPAATASLYYYDSNKRSWTMVNPEGYRNPERSISAYTPRGAGGAYWPYYNLDYYPVYRVTETSVGFDAVGRKIVSGTASRVLNTYNSFTYQTDEGIGSTYTKRTSGYNTYINDFEIANSVISREYGNSITDNSSFFPNKTQMFDIGVNQPFLIEKVVVDIPFYINGGWFNDVTTCSRAFGFSTGSIPRDPDAIGRFVGPVDFGGPGITFALMCARRGEANSYLDLIASGTITHMNDMTSSVVLKKDPGMEYHCLRPTGFNLFSNPTTVISGTNNIFEGIVKLEMEASVAGGVTFVRLDKSNLTGSNVTETMFFTGSNVNLAKRLLTQGTLNVRGESSYNTYDTFASSFSEYESRSARVYVQQISPLSRGSAKINFNGNSVLGGNIASFNSEEDVINPLYTGYTISTLPSQYTNQLSSASFAFEATSVYSTVDSRPSPYLILPGDKLTVSLSKTRPVVYKAVETDGGPPYYPLTVSPLYSATYGTYILSGSHDTVMLNTGSINITLYGSYIKEGMEYHP